ncbi:MAG TPA: hypothetical protein VNY55_01590, partial [Mycobacterium sp.]|nr:hypothetical protein [Mycobacterium sp.]
IAFLTSVFVVLTSVFVFLTSVLLVLHAHAPAPFRVAVSAVPLLRVTRCSVVSKLSSVQSLGLDQHQQRNWDPQRPGRA